MKTSEYQIEVVLQDTSVQICITLLYLHDYLILPDGLN